MSEFSEGFVSLGNVFVTFPERTESFVTTLMDKPISDEDVFTVLNQFGALSQHGQQCAMSLVECHLMAPEDAVLPMVCGQLFFLHALNPAECWPERMQQLEFLCGQDGISVKPVRIINLYEGERMVYAFYGKGS